MICQIQIKLLLKSSSFNGQRLSSEQSAFGSITPWRHIMGTFLKRLRVCLQVMRCLVFTSVCQLIGRSCETFRDVIFNDGQCASVVRDGPAIQRGST